MFHNLYICSCITCCLIVYNYLYYHALCGAFSEIKKFQSFYCLAEVAVATLRPQCSIDNYVRTASGSDQISDQKVNMFEMTLSGWWGISSTLSQLSTEFNHFFRFSILWTPCTFFSVGVW